MRFHPLASDGQSRTSRLTAGVTCPARRPAFSFAVISRSVELIRPELSADAFHAAVDFAEEAERATARAFAHSPRAQVRAQAGPLQTGRAVQVDDERPFSDERDDELLARRAGSRPGGRPDGHVEETALLHLRAFRAARPELEAESNPDDVPEHFAISVVMPTRHDTPVDATTRTWSAVRRECDLPDVCPASSRPASSLVVQPQRLDQLMPRTSSAREANASARAAPTCSPDEWHPIGSASAELGHCSRRFCAAQCGGHWPRALPRTRGPGRPELSVSLAKPRPRVRPCLVLTRSDHARSSSELAPRRALHERCAWPELDVQRRLSPALRAKHGPRVGSGSRASSRHYRPALNPDNVR